MASLTYEETLNAADLARVTDFLVALIEACKDTEKGFQLVAGEFNDAELNHLCERLAGERNQSASEFNEDLFLLGAPPMNTGTLNENLRREWASFSSWMDRDREAQLLQECIRGEDRLTALCRQARELPLPPQIAERVQRLDERVSSTANLFR